MRLVDRDSHFVTQSNSTSPSLYFLPPAATAVTIGIVSCVGKGDDTLSVCGQRHQKNGFRLAIGKVFIIPNGVWQCAWVVRDDEYLSRGACAKSGCHSFGVCVWLGECLIAVRGQEAMSMVVAVANSRPPGSHKCDIGGRWPAEAGGGTGRHRPCDSRPKTHRATARRSNHSQPRQPKPDHTNLDSGGGRRRGTALPLRQQGKAAPRHRPPQPTQATRMRWRWTPPPRQRRRATARGGIGLATAGRRRTAPPHAAATPMGDYSLCILF